MALDKDTIAKLTVSLAGDVELFNVVINDSQATQTTLDEKEQEIVATKVKLEETEQRNSQYLGQISNLLSKIPVGKTETPQSYEQKVEEIKNRAWHK